MKLIVSTLSSSPFTAPQRDHGRVDWPFPRVLGADSEGEGVMGIAATVELRGVEVVSESDLALCCRIRGRDYWIAQEHLLEGSSVIHFADRGMIVVTRAFAEERGLLRDRARPLL